MNGNGRARAASAAAATRSTARVKSSIGLSRSPVESSIDAPTSPTSAARRIVSAAASGACPYPFSRSAATGRSVASTIALALERASSRVTEPSPSRRPSVNASPALVVVRASKPRPARIRAVPASHGLGMTNASGRSWSTWNRFAFSACGMLMGRPRFVPARRALRGRIRTISARGRGGTPRERHEAPERNRVLLALERELRPREGGAARACPGTFWNRDVSRRWRRGSSRSEGKKAGKETTMERMTEVVEGIDTGHAGILGTKEAVATIAVKNLKTARDFYVGKLGLKSGADTGSEVLTLESGRSKVFVYVSEFARTNKATAATWLVGGELESIVRDLKGKGIAFEHYDM